MVGYNDKELVGRTISGLRDWVTTLPPETARVTENVSPVNEYEYTLDIRPLNSNASYIEFGIRIDSTFDMRLGKRVSFCAVPLSMEHIKEACEAVFAGRLKEELWEWGNTVIRSKGDLDLGSKHYYCDGSHSWLYILHRIFGFGYYRLIVYEPWRRGSIL